MTDNIEGLDTPSTYELPRVLVSPDLFETAPMTDEQALLKAQSIWGPHVSLSRSHSIGVLVCQHYAVLLWTDDEISCEQVAGYDYYPLEGGPPASWEAMFASVQAVAQ